MAHIWIEDNRRALLTQEDKMHDDEFMCKQCQQVKPGAAFSRQRGKADERCKICEECERLNRQERHRRLIIQKEIWQQPEREETKQKELERKIAFHQAYEERWRERENWYLQQPDRLCKACHRILPATAFGGNFSTNNFVLHTRCRSCHEALRERHQPVCCVCQVQTTRANFLSRFNGYELRSNGIAISLCCKACEETFSALPEMRQDSLIRSICQRSFPAGQVIYAEVDPESCEIRYIGRTGQPQRRHAQHLKDASSVAGRWGTEKKEWYTRSNWIQTLSDHGLTPFMQILHAVENSPLVVEWEQRYIWYGIQQGWRLLNVEAVDEELVAHIQSASIDFLTVPFEKLVQQHFFSSHGLVAFLHKYYS
jgi:hypothetical protein